MPACLPAEAAQPEALVGDPVDVVTGRVTDRSLDFRLIGPLVLEWHRYYDSSRNRIFRSLGYGHAHAYDLRLRFDADGLSLEDATGRRSGFPPLPFDGARAEAGGAAIERLDLRSYRVERPGLPSLEFVFRAPDAPARVARVAQGPSEIRFHYDRSGALVGITHSTGLRIDAEEDPRGTLLRLEGKWDGRAVRSILTCEYDEAYNLTGMTDAFGRCWSFAYDAENRMVRKTDRRGYSFFFEYDAAGRCLRSAGEDGVLGVALRYFPEERRTEVTKADGGEWQYFYDAGGALTLVIGPHGEVRRFARDASGRASGEVDPLGNELTYVYDRRDRLVGKRFPAGRVVEVRGGTEMAAPPSHRVAGKPAEWDWGDLLRTLEVAPDRSGYGSSPLALARRAAPPMPPPVAVSPPVPPCCDDCDPWYPEPEAGRHFGPFGHLLSQDLPGGGLRRWNYDANDNMEAYADADGAVTRQFRHSWNQLEQVIDPLGGATQYRWTAQEHLAAVVDPGGTRSEYDWDQQGRLIGVRRGGVLRETYRYDAAGNLVEKRDGDGATLLTLEPTADRLVAERRLASGDVHRFAYDRSGRFLSAASNGGEVRFDYDELGRRILDERDGQGVRHAYAGLEGLAETIVLGRYAIRYERDGAGSLLLRLPGHGVLRLERTGERQIWRACGNGTGELSQYDWMGRCTFRGLASERGGMRPWSRKYRYSWEGDLQEVEDSREGTTRYRYDRAHRLVAAEPPSGPAQVFDYDAAGNLLRQPGLEGVRLAGGNRLAAANGETFSYDLRQHIAARQGAGETVRYHYDSRDMLVACELRDGTTWRAEYDAIGRRTRVEWGGAAWSFYWDTDRLAAEVDPAGRLRIYAYAGPLALTPVAFVDYLHEGTAPEEGEAFYVFADQRGAPVLVEDEQGKAAWRARLESYGAAAIEAPGGLALNLRFPGHYFDAATGLHYNRFRYYDPKLGRYIQSDPIGIAGGPNLYAYPSNPLMRVDLRGLSGSGGEGDSCPIPVAKGQGEDKEDKELLDKSGAFKDPDLEDDYQNYVARKEREGGAPRSREDWQATRDYWQNSSPMARGNKFNQTAGEDYPFNEVHLENGKRVDSYDPEKGEIISRKATDFDKIQDDTFKKYLDEMKQKYSPEEVVRSNKYSEIDGQPLEGQQIMEVPKSNENSPNREKFEKMAQDNGIVVRYKEE